MLTVGQQPAVLRTGTWETSSGMVSVGYRRPGGRWATFYSLMLRALIRILRLRLCLFF